MLSNACFLSKFRFDTAENEPAKNLPNLLIFPILLTLTLTPNPNPQQPQPRDLRLGIQTDPGDLRTDDGRSDDGRGPGSDERGPARDDPTGPP